MNGALAATSAPSEQYGLLEEEVAYVRLALQVLAPPLSAPECTRASASTIIVLLTTYSPGSPGFRIVGQTADSLRECTHQAKPIAAAGGRAPASANSGSGSRSQEDAPAPPTATAASFSTAAEAIATAAASPVAPPPCNATVRRSEAALLLPRLRSAPQQQQQQTARARKKILPRGAAIVGRRGLLIQTMPLLLLIWTHNTPKSQILTCV